MSVLRAQSFRNEKSCCWEYVPEWLADLLGALEAFVLLCETKFALSHHKTTDF